MVHASWPRRSTTGRSARRAETRPFRGSIVLTSGPPGYGRGGVREWPRTRATPSTTCNTDGAHYLMGGGCSRGPRPGGRAPQWAGGYRTAAFIGGAVHAEPCCPWFGIQIQQCRQARARVAAAVAFAGVSNEVASARGRRVRSGNGRFLAATIRRSCRWVQFSPSRRISLSWSTRSSLACARGVGHLVEEDGAAGGLLSAGRCGPARRR